MTSSSSCSVSMALDSWRPSSSARSSRSSSPPVSTRTPSKTIVPRARRHPRSGTVTVDVASSAGEVTSARECRRAAAAGANASCALTVTPRTTWPGIRGSLEHEVMGTPIVNPDRRAVRAEQTLRAQAEDLEPGRQVHRGRDAGGEVVDQRAEVALQLVAAPQAVQLERRDECIRRGRGIGRNRPAVGPLAKADDEQADALVPARERQEPRRRRAEPLRQIRHLASDVGDERGRASREHLRDEPPSPRDRGSTDRSAVRRGRSPTWPAATRCAGCARTAACRCRRSRRSRAGAAAAAGRPGPSRPPAGQQRRGDGDGVARLGRASRPRRGGSIARYGFLGASWVGMTGVGAPAKLYAQRQMTIQIGRGRKRRAARGV